MADVRGAGGRILDQSVRPKASSIADKSVSTPLGDAPMIPVLLIVSGLYLCWFAVHYWAGDIAWPSDPVKALLTGKPLPVPDKGKAIKTELAKLQTQDTHVMTPAEIAQLGQSTADAKLNPGLSAGGVLSHATYGHTDLEWFWTSNGGSAGTADLAAAIAQAESSGKADNTSSNPDGGTNVGLWQLDTKGEGAGYSMAQLIDPNMNAKITVMKTANGTNWSKWETYVNGTYKQYLTGK